MVIDDAVYAMIMRVLLVNLTFIFGHMPWVVTKRIKSLIKKKVK